MKEMKTLVLNIRIMATMVALVAGGFLLVCRAQKPTDNIARLKEKFENCKMLTVGLDELGYTIKVPDFFQQEPTDELYTLHYIYEDEASGLRFFASTFVTDAEGLDAETAVKEFTQEATLLFKEIGPDYYIIEEPMEEGDDYVDLDKTFFVGRYCLSLHFFFPNTYRQAVQRYIDIVKAWNPIPEE